MHFGYVFLGVKGRRGNGCRKYATKMQNEMPEFWHEVCRERDKRPQALPAKGIRNKDNIVPTLIDNTRPKVLSLYSFSEAVLTPLAQRSKY